MFFLATLNVTDTFVNKGYWQFKKPNKKLRKQIIGREKSLPVFTGHLNFVRKIVSSLIFFTILS